MELINDPQRLAALAASAYWLSVIVMVARSWIRFKGPAGALPKNRLEKRMWFLWVPTIVAWVVLAWTTDNQVSSWLADHANSDINWIWQSITWAAGIMAIIAFLGTTYCWVSMGRNWSMAITPGKKTELLTTGVFAWARHPIYALSLLLMISTLIAVANVFMLIAAIIHVTMLYTKAWNEERYLHQLHGDEYQRYCENTGRFSPWRTLTRHFFSERRAVQELS